MISDPKTKHLFGNKIKLHYDNRFTEWLPEAEDCHDWYLWFWGRGIPCAIGKSSMGCAVYRTGMIDGPAWVSTRRKPEPFEEVG